ncbi:MAG TPA: hypothetical protein DER05_13780 [Lutibacter sp.]|nr:hypothetical protein [Lutibacter sp.]
MKEEHFQPINKSGLERIKELYFSLRIISDCQSLIEKGNYYQISIVYGQLRSLLTERSKGLTPLLFDISSILNVDLELFHIPDTFEKDLPHLMENLSFRFNSTQPSISKISPNQKKISLKDFLDITVATNKSKKYTVREIINELANKYGGSHYSQKTNRSLLELLSFGINNQTMLDQFIIQLADLTYQFGIKVLKKITDIELFMHLYLTPKKIKNEVFLLDYKLPNNMNRFSIILNQKRLHFKIIDTLGFYYEISSNCLIDYNKIHLLNISIETTNNFNTSIKIYIQENLVGELFLENSILTFNQMHSYECYMNKAIDGEKQKYEFGLSEFKIYSKLQNYVQKNQLFEFYTSKEYNNIFWIGENEFVHKKSEKRDFEMSNGFKKKDIKNGA